LPALARGEALGEDRHLDRGGGAGRARLRLGEDRSGQAVHAEEFDERLGDAADFPADHRAVPTRDRLILNRISFVERGREIAGIIVEPGGGAARGEESAGDPAAVFDKGHLLSRGAFF